VGLQGLFDDGRQRPRTVVGLLHSMNDNHS
jgi:hypothetical protein